MDFFLTFVVFAHELTFNVKLMFDKYWNQTSLTTLSQNLLFDCMRTFTRVHCCGIGQLFKADRV